MSPTLSPEDSNPSEDRPDQDRPLERSEALYREFISRQSSGEEVDPDEYLQKYPELQEDLKILFDRLKDKFSADLTPKEGEDCIIGDFKIICVIGRGGMGTVYEAEQISLKRRVALKVLPSHLRFSDEAVSKFQREAEAGGRQHHAGIVAIYAVGEDKGVHYIAQELVEGSYTLADRLAVLRNKGEQPPGYFRDVATFVSRAAEALQHAHDTGVIHRDVKPSNILLTMEGKPKITDFGLAKVEDALALSRTGDFAGTPYYMSPEQAMSRRIGIDYRTDVYSLGVTLYEMLCLKRPFEGKTSHDVLRQIILIDPRDPHKTNPNVPRDLSTICLKAMEKHPEQRYQGMTEFIEDLERFLSGDVILAKPSGLGTRLWKCVKRNPVVSAASAVAILAIVIFATVVPWIIATNEKKARIEIEKQRKIADDRLKLNYQLSAGKDIERLISDARRLWPANPDNIEAYEDWIRRMDDLFDRVAEYQNEVETLRGQALPYTDEIRRRDQETHPKWNGLLTLRNQREELARKIETIETGKNDVDQNMKGESSIRLEALKQELAEKDEKIGSLEEEVFKRRTWKFENPETKQWHDHLAGLISEIEDLLGQQQNTRKDIVTRLEFARTVQKRSIDDHREAWDRAIASIADQDECPGYNGLEISEQLGLVPLGMDPASGLWEFAHIRTGDIPERGEDGKLVFTEASGLIFVLIPGGSFQMGSKLPSTDHPLGSPNTDPMSVAYERPVHERRIKTFFLSKYEMTQGQWSRFRFHNPSGYIAGREYRGKKITLLHPVEYVSWQDSRNVMYQIGLRLPTEAEWEYACRAGTTTVYWTGDEKETLKGAANLYDLTYKRGDDRPWEIYEEWLDDEYHLHAPVGSYRPNPFGLYDMHGNVSEWCMDTVPRSMNYDDAPADGSAVERYMATTFILRGGSYFKRAVLCRSACRSHDILTIRYMDNGVRPAFSLK